MADPLSDRERFALILRAHHTSVAIATSEEAYVLSTIVGAATDVGRAVQLWSVVRGICSGLFAEDHEVIPDTQMPVSALRNFALGNNARVLVTLDLAAHLDANEITMRAWREAVESCRRSGSTLVMIDHREALPEVVSETVLRFTPSLPDAAELSSLARETLRILRDDEHLTVEVTNAQFAALVRNLLGLTRRQAEEAIRDVAVANPRFDGSAVRAVVALRRRLLHRRGLIETIEMPVTEAEVAGMARLKRWLSLRAKVMSSPTPIPGLPPPRGILLLGVSGSGKSLCAKAIATVFGQPLLRLDTGVLYDRYVGESERRLREALRQAETMAPAVLWIDEIEKAFASASSHGSDGGLSQRMFGSLLTWMQERTSTVFMVATANDIASLPPELLRKGRFDEIFFVDLPGPKVRSDLVRIHLLKRHLDPAHFDIPALVEAADGRSGAEIEQAIIDARYEANAAGQPPATAHIVAALNSSPPLSVTMAERIAAMRSWASTRCVAADAPG